MKPKTCTHCAAEIEGKPVSYRGHVFCSDECCEEYDEVFAAKGGPADDDLDDDLDKDLADEEFDEDDFDDEDVGYKDDEDDDDLDFDDDDYDIKPDDF